MGTDIENAPSKLETPKISEETVSKLKRMAKADALLEYLSPDEAKEIIEEFHRLSVLLLAERCGNIIISGLARPGVVARLCSTMSPTYETHQTKPKP